MLPSSFFTRQEFACKCGCGFDTVDAGLLDLLNYIRKEFASPVIITSGCRCSIYNRHVGGKSHSQHLIGRAADIFVKEIPLEDVWTYLNKYFPDEYGFGLYNSFIHVDTRSEIASRW